MAVLLVIDIWLGCDSLARLVQVVIKDQGPPCKIVLGVALKGQARKNMNMSLNELTLIALAFGMFVWA